MSSESPKDSASIEKSPWKGPSLAIQRSEFFENIKFYKRSIKFRIYFELKESILLYKVKMRRIESILDVNWKIYRKENNGKYKDICISFSISYFNSNATWNALQVKKRMFILLVLQNRIFHSKYKHTLLIKTFCNNKKLIYI